MSDDDLAARKAALTAMERDALLADARAVLRTAEGRRLLWWLLNEAGTYSTTYVPGDSHASAFAEGRRNVGIQLEVTLAQADPLAVVDMQRESVEAKRKARALREAAAIDHRSEADGSR
jgi:hypothetical protein